MKKGDILQVVQEDGSLDFAGVLCVVESENDRPLTVLQNGLLVTNKHPVFHNGSWKKACEISSVVSPCDSTVFDFVLDTTKVALIVNEFPTVTFGHGMSDPYHEFWSTNKVIDALQTLDFDSGHIYLKLGFSLKKEFNK